jgi:hypothetical protein
VVNVNNGYDKLAFPMRTEMAYQLQNDDESQGYLEKAFIVAFSIEKVNFRPSKLKFLKGLAIAIFVAAFDLDDDLEMDGMQNDETNGELDVKEFVPMRPHNSTLNLTDLASTGELADLLSTSPGAISSSMSSSMPQLGFSPQLEPIFEMHDNKRDGEHSFGELDDDHDHDESLQFRHDVGLDLSDSEGRRGQLLLREKAAALPIMPTRMRAASVGSISVTGSTTARIAIPAWMPAAPFSFPIVEIPIKHLIPSDLTLDTFVDVKHIADGSNSNIFLARYNGPWMENMNLLNHQKVIIKMIKEDVESDAVAIQEFELEFGTLARLSHPNIISILGAGTTPRRFIVLEFLGGGSLNTMLAQNPQRNDSKFAVKLFKKPTFTYTNLLQNAKYMADALDYLHRGCHLGATIIHRGTYNTGLNFSAIMCVFGLVVDVLTV